MDRELDTFVKMKAEIQRSSYDAGDIVLVIDTRDGLWRIARII